MGDKPWTHPIAPLDVPVCILMRSVLSQRNRATGEQVSRFPKLPLGRREFRAQGRSHVPLAEELEELRRRENIEKAAQEPEPQWVSPVSSWGHLAIFLVLGRSTFFILASEIHSYSHIHKKALRGMKLCHCTCHSAFGG